MTNDFLFESAPFASCHAATIVAPAAGELLAAWFGGTKEGANDVAIWLSRFAGNQWSAPEKVAEEKGVPCWNPVLFRERKSGEITLFYKAGISPMAWSGLYKRSHDGGRTWSEAYILPAGLLGPIKNKPLQLADGAILSPTSVESYRAWACWVERSGDGGRTWTRHGPIAHPQHPHGVIQPSILRGKDGLLFMLMRSRGVGQVCRSDSRDGGVTWSPAVAVDSLPNPNSGIDAVTLTDGRHVLIYNPTHIGRTPLALAISSDDGQTWQAGPTLESTPGEYSYPAIIQAADGRIHAAYTWKRQRIRHWVFDLDEFKG